MITLGSSGGDNTTERTENFVRNRYFYVRLPRIIVNRCVTVLPNYNIYYVRISLNLRFRRNTNFSVFLRIVDDIVRLKKTESRSSSPFFFFSELEQIRMFPFFFFSKYFFVYTFTPNVNSIIIRKFFFFLSNELHDYRLLYFPLHNLCDRYIFFCVLY